MADHDTAPLDDDLRIAADATEAEVLAAVERVAGRARIEGYFSWTSVAEKWLAVIEDAISARAKS